MPAGLWGADAVPGRRDTDAVQSGDARSGIAARHGVTGGTLRQSDRLDDDAIRTNQGARVRGDAAKDFPLLAAWLTGIEVPNLARARWKHIILHHSATPNGNAAIFDRYHREARHMEHGLAYHFIVGNGTDSKDGQIEIGPRWTGQLRGGHVKSEAYNEDSIGVCLVGNFEETRPTRRQIGRAHV